MFTVRPLEPQEFDFFTDMHYESIHIPQGKPPKHELLNEPHLKKYHEGWGRKGDRAIVALKDDQLAGGGVVQGVRRGESRLWLRR